ncbi:MAG: DUF167 domain-containing protein [bacterium]|nr:DUF167 domain-containing protein [bacterium]
MLLTILVKPNSHQTKIVGWRDRSTVVIAVCEPAVDGKANRALILFLAKRLNLPKSRVEIRRGQSGRVKHVHLPDDANLRLIDPAR